MSKKPKPALTARQQEVFEFLKEFIKTNKYPPTRKELCDHFGFKSRMAAHDHLKALEKKGRIIIVPNISRGTVIKRGN